MSAPEASSSGGSICTCSPRRSAHAWISAVWSVGDRKLSPALVPTLETRTYPAHGRPLTAAAYMATRARSIGAADCGVWP